jgi:hypothetical protein
MTDDAARIVALIAQRSGGRTSTTKWTDKINIDQ